MNTAILKVIYPIIKPIMKPIIVGILGEVIDRIKLDHGLLSHRQLMQLIDDGVITARPEHVNAASIDLTLGTRILKEPVDPKYNRVVNVGKKESIQWEALDMGPEGYTLQPGEIVLAESVEVFNLPNHISGEYKLKSSQARTGLDHANAGWADAGWNGSVLTLEFKNNSRFHELTLSPGDKCGQMVFFQHEAVPNDASYATRGQYNGDLSVTGNKGLR